MFLFVFNKLLFSLRIYQQAHYEIKKYIKYMIKNFLYINLFPLIILITSFVLDNNLVKMISYIVLDLYSFFYLKRKVKLKFTKRIIRLFIVSLLINILVFIPFLLVFLEYILILIFFITNIIENKINDHYIVKCIYKLNEFKGVKIAITGSFGKTSTKYYLYNILKESYPTLVMPNSYNTPIGIAKVINNTNLEKYQYIIFEMGATKLYDIEYLMGIINPNISIITSIGAMHLDSFKSIDNIIKEKCKAIDLLDNGIGIINASNDYLYNYKFKNKVISYGIDRGIYRIKIIDSNRFSIYVCDELFDNYYINLNGEFNILNLAGVIIVLYLLGISKDEIKLRILSLKNPNARLSVTNFNNLIIINDGFNSNLTGAYEALNMLKTYNNYKIIITPLFVEMRLDLHDYYDYMLSICDLILLVGYYETKDAYNYMKEKGRVYITNSFKEAMKIVFQISKRKTVSVLIENDLPDIYKKGFL